MKENPVRLVRDLGVECCIILRNLKDSKEGKGIEGDVNADANEVTRNLKVKGWESLVLC